MKEITITLTEKEADAVLEALYERLETNRTALIILKSQSSRNEVKHKVKELTAIVDKINAVSQEKKNTLFSYLYRDAGNYKSRNECVLSGEMTQEDYDRICACCVDGENFIPSQVGLEENRNWDFDPEMDHPWFELTGFETTNRKGAVMSVQELVEAFEKCKDKWQPEKSDFYSC